MAFSYTRDVGDGVKTIFSLSFAGQDNGYIASANIHVYVDGTEVPFTINQSDPNKVYLSSPPAAGSNVLIRRKMPQNLPYADFQNGQPFSQDTLNKSFLQQLYLTQELLDGFLPDGFYYKQDVNMGGFNIKNLGTAVDPDDAVKKSTTDSLANRLMSLENNLDDLASRTVPWVYQAIGGETELSPPFSFKTALVFINGVNQILSDAYTVADNKIKLSEQLLAGDKVFALIGNYPAEPSDSISFKEAGLLFASIQAGVPIGNTFMAVVGEKVTNALAFFDGQRIYTSATPLTGTITAINWPSITIS